MNRIVLVILSLAFSPAVAQQSIQGNTADLTGKPLPYVNIGIPGKNIGTVSAENGNFKLQLDSGFSERDTIVFSYIGYETRKIAYADFKSVANRVLLKPAEYLLDEITVQQNKMVDKKFGRRSNGLGLMHWNFYSAKEKDVDDRLSKELGMSFKVRKECLLTGFNFAVSSNEYSSLRFRINIYNVKDNQPDSLIITDNIFHVLNDQITGWQFVDLKPYNIYLDNTMAEILVTIQWVESERATTESKYFAIPASKSPLHKIYFRDKAMDSWKSQTGNLSMYIEAKCVL